MEAAAALTTPDPQALDGIDWSFTAEAGAHPIHGLHPYPAKFVPALPRRVIEALTRPGDLVFDPFVGSGTALVEALLAGRRGVGGDLNPVAVVAATAKTRLLSAEQVGSLQRWAAQTEARVRARLQAGAVTLPDAWTPVGGRRFKGLEFWFDEQIARELAALREVIRDELDPDVAAVLRMCFSSIIVAVSWQDSDTRYVRRQKAVGAGAVGRLYVRRLLESIDALGALRATAPEAATVVAADAREADYVREGSAALMITSPPYPNAWSYHLYHQNRILWLEEDPWEFKAREIGHHRAYSAANGATSEDFARDIGSVLEHAARALRPGGHAVVVIGDSIVRGEFVRNDHIVAAAAAAAGLASVVTFKRVIDPKRKAFIPSIGSIKTEHVLVYRR